MIFSPVRHPSFLHHNQNSSTLDKKHLCIQTLLHHHSSTPEVQGLDIMPPRGSYMNWDDQVLIDVLKAILVAEMEKWDVQTRNLMMELLHAKGYIFTRKALLYKVLLLLPVFFVYRNCYRTASFFCSTSFTSIIVITTMIAVTMSTEALLTV